ncbi:hypothetical protein KZ483_23800 [Paenibacillus sp. sptzw28]|uniref:hypothetical protein n=1 Tax=Paenibacillus sp. sptzw28 TaxID=715179 RepID=UPI001C6F2EA1|nr:hypothetical protein [Paenibacillus sp. sptzw28]QYR20749.1 hypothetical protein KZ483_23800 [Paenibacillus sp. sptzw28]
MWTGVILYTLGTVAVTFHQFRYWQKNGQGAEKWVFAGWMLTAWAVGVLLMAGVKFPVPVKPLFPNWK